MGRSKIAIPFDAEELRSKVYEKMSLSDLAEKLEVTRQAVSNWFTEELIPPRRLIAICEMIELDPKIMRRLFNERESRKHLARTNAILREENEKLRKALAIFTERDSL